MWKQSEASIWKDFSGLLAGATPVCAAPYQQSRIAFCRLSGDAWKLLNTAKTPESWRAGALK